MILYGKPVAEAIRKEYVENFSKPKQRTLTVIADETSDQHYLWAIKSAAVEWDVEVREVTTEPNPTMMTSERWIDLRKNAKTRQGFYAMDGQSVSSALGAYRGATSSITPCTPEAIVAMLDYYKIPIAGKNVCILGRSERVGKPLALLMMARDATVTVCHSKTDRKWMYEAARWADIVVCATGEKGLIERGDITQLTSVVNVGGDYDETTGHEDINLIPYKGGVGCATTAVLMHHVMM